MNSVFQILENICLVWFSNNQSQKRTWYCIMCCHSKNSFIVTWKICFGRSVFKVYQHFQFNCVVFLSKEGTESLNGWYNYMYCLFVPRYLLSSEVCCDKGVKRFKDFAVNFIFLSDAFPAEHAFFPRSATVFCFLIGRYSSLHSYTKVSVPNQTLLGYVRKIEMQSRYSAVWFRT